jgi:hypothetical protein
VCLIGINEYDVTLISVKAAVVYYNLCFAKVYTKNLYSVMKMILCEYVITLTATVYVIDLRSRVWLEVVVN